VFGAPGALPAARARDASLAGDWRASLNPAQQEAVTFGDGPVLVIAGAGTGKTWTLACRVAYLVEQGVAPERILLLTFSRRAARELLQRADRLLSASRGARPGLQRVWGGTFHAIANRLLRLHGRPLGLSPDFTVLDQADMADLLDLIRGEQQPPRGHHERRFPRKDTLVAIYSRMVNASRPLSSVLQSAFPWCQDEADGIRAIFAEYTRRKRVQNVLDYDDLLLFWRALGDLPAGQTAAAQFDHVLVDEYQDTNPLQAQILHALRRTNRTIMVVGDDAQAIYSFRAASVRNILDFPSQFPGTRRITLEANYRSTQPILAASNAVISHARERFPKQLRAVRPGGTRPVLLTCSDEAEQSVQVCEAILAHREQGIPLRQQAVLFRSGHHSDLLELELGRRNIPFVKYGGLKFLEAAHVKDVLAILRILENPRDEVSWFRVLQLLDGIGPSSARGIMAAIGVRPAPAAPAAAASRGPSPLDAPTRRSPTSPSAASPIIDRTTAASFAAMPTTTAADVEADADAEAASLAVGPPGAHAPAAPDADSPAATPLQRLLRWPPRVPEAAREPLAQLAETLSDCLAAAAPPAIEVARIRRFCEPIFERRYSSPTARLRDIEQLEAAAGTHTSRGRFLSELALDPPTATSDLAGPPLLDEDYLILSTVHSAKGGEWDVVYVLHAADGMFPSDMATGEAESIEEERRLFYVALTRARDRLYVTFAQRAYRRPRGLDDAHHYAQLTRFLPSSVLGLFERRTAGAQPSSIALSATPGAARDGRHSVEAHLAALWDA